MKELKITGFLSLILPAINNKVFACGERDTLSLSASPTLCGYQSTNSLFDLLTVSVLVFIVLAVFINIVLISVVSAVLKIKFSIKNILIIPLLTVIAYIVGFLSALFLGVGLLDSGFVSLAIASLFSFILLFIIGFITTKRILKINSKKASIYGAVQGVFMNFNLFIIILSLINGD